MCLERVDKVYKGTSRIIRIRYKVFQLHKRTGKLYSAYGFPVCSIPKGIWLDENLYRIPGSKNTIDSVDGEYPMGWHVYVLEETAKALSEWFNSNKHIPDLGTVFVMRKVYCKGLLVVGLDLGDKVEVYKYIKIEKEV